jgi:small subunit ribosomal protein S20
VLVVARETAGSLIAVRLSSQDHDDDLDWIPIGAGTWDGEGRPPGWTSAAFSGFTRKACAAKQPPWTATASIWSSGGYGTATAGCDLPFWFAPCRADNLSHSGAPDSSYLQGSSVANIKQQKKRILTNEKARQRNKAVKSSLKTAVRKFNAAAEAGDAEQAATLAREAGRKLDKAASKGVIHKNQAANRKSAIAKRAATL